MKRFAGGNKNGECMNADGASLAPPSERTGPHFEPRFLVLRRVFGVFAFLLTISLQAQPKVSVCTETLPTSVHLSNEAGQPSADRVAKLRVLTREVSQKSSDSKGLPAACHYKRAAV